MSACEKAGEWQSALLLLEAMRRVDIPPGVTAYSAGISACEKGTQWQRAVFLLTEVMPQAE